ncbi:hypothetical protein [Deinococcus peraridilitoris]|uniref:Uncharacterized protein n=1 Tax=Deinococcus peraridilitoris (strain DSM 19664 / LMG 22246 / CIP 109416 / KR-200) TaxID=937777 RepID=L0A5F4_DEIPD|nr:hypothetical protein [Deinococcus peraridilitoris]AFZ68250.1 hypothetical protein Deipe_2786 [Deinococcus peraridilitoris DSM 19664]
MLELRTQHFTLYALGVADEPELAGAGSVDVLVELQGGERFAGTVRTLGSLDSELTAQAFVPVTDSLIVRDLTAQGLVDAVAALLAEDALDEIFLEVLEEIQVEV